VARTDADREAIMAALRGTIRLQGGMLSDVWATYQRYLKGEAPRYDFVKHLGHARG